MSQFPIRVGIYSEPRLTFVFLTPYYFDGREYLGEYTASAEEGKVLFMGKAYDSLLFEGDGSFVLKGVTIGVNFHWERKEDQTFIGHLQLIPEHGIIGTRPATDYPTVTAINIVGVEDYLESVISSEMSATSSFTLLKAHAVTSRSWLLYPILNKPTTTISDAEHTENTILRFYERDAHTNFDVCADDHCQRYQGITRKEQAANKHVREAIEATWGQVLRDNDGRICDARFYKSCGGITEAFENVWAPTQFHYLQPIVDSPTGQSNGSLLTRQPKPLDLSQESQAEAFIRTIEDNSFCNTHDAQILAQVLNNYDQETHDFYRWRVSYTQAELSELIARRSGVDFGKIIDLIPIQRGPSGRLIRLKIVGSKKTMTIGKELEIRKWLSPSHLYSSAFIVEKSTTPANAITFTLLGAGWGHGVGLCQIGAAVMAAKGYTYEQILAHYFPGSHLTTL